MCYNRRKFRGIPSLIKGLFVLGMIALFVFILGQVIMYLWNEILVEATGVRPLTFWKSLGLFVLARILFGGFRSSSRPSRWSRKKKAWKEKWRNMSEEERVEFKSKWKNRRKNNY